ncbi:MAG: hydrogenase maturation nickel metallochaperone HypA [Actinomycetota bacterium]|nr:hydrogenase maturation nickel metallochaperone HypA [Actinomycetota bacterium]
MHEFPITKSIIDIIKEKIAGKDIKKVLRINLLINPYGGIEPDSVKFYYKLLSKNEPALKNAILVFKKEKIKIQCINCGRCFEVFKLVSACSKCKSKNLSVSLPKDMVIKSIEI